MIILILLASGYSSRFGENKLLYEIDEMPMYRHMLDSALSFQKESVEPVRLILVTAYEEIGEYAASEAGFSYNGRLLTAESAADTYTQDRRILVYNRNQAAGISHSIALGIKTVPDENDDDCLMFAVCDQPYLRSGDMLALTDGFRRSGKGIGCMAFGGRTGNPVIFKRRYEEKLLSLTGDTGGKTIVKAYKEDAFFYEPKDPMSLKDIDRKEEAAKS